LKGYFCFFIFSHSTFDVGRSMFDVLLFIVSWAKTTFKDLNPNKPELTNYKQHQILKLGQINPKLQYPNLK